MATQRELSRKEWTGENNREDINAGSLQRIADATEKMAQGYANLETDRNIYKRMCEDEQRRRELLERRVAGLRGAFGRLKRKHQARG